MWKPRPLPSLTDTSQRGAGGRGLTGHGGDPQGDADGHLDLCALQSRRAAGELLAGRRGTEPPSCRRRK